ncbi:MAG: hypothetical protein ABIG95_00425 [Candidatus Woesearchaeota archaeon]
MELLGLQPSLRNYAVFNDPLGFHEPSKPWKAHNPKLEELLRAHCDQPYSFHPALM